jgi:hypothetical protein
VGRRSRAGPATARRQTNLGAVVGWDAGLGPGPAAAPVDGPQGSAGSGRAKADDGELWHAAAPGPIESFCECMAATDRFDVVPKNT